MNMRYFYFKTGNDSPESVKHRKCNTFIHTSLLLLAMVMFWSTSVAQTLLQGRVVDQNDVPLSGVSVRMLGSAVATSTDANGTYSIPSSTTGTVLVFSYIGKVTQQIVVGNQTVINVTLEDDGQDIEEVVVVGYGTQTRDKLTTSISKVDNKVLENTTYTNAGSALQGAVAGLRVQTNSGQPGEGPRIILRGGTSINNPNGAAPLYIVDGVIRSGGLDDINASDIETMQVLKDAASTAIYGARGSNGVVIVTTKTGESGRTDINYRYDFSAANAQRVYDYASAADYIHYGRLAVQRQSLYNASVLPMLGQSQAFGTGNDLSKNTGYTTMYLTDQNSHLLNEGWESIPDPIDPSKAIIFKETVFQDLIYQTGRTHNHNLNVSGGTERAKFNAGVGYVAGEGTTISTDYQRLSLNLNGSLQVRENLKLISRLLYSNRNMNAVASLANTFYRGASLPGTAKYEFEDGSMAPGRGLSMGNPHYFLIGQHARQGKNNYERMTVAVSAKWDILDNLYFEPIVSLTTNVGDSYTFQPTYLNGAGTLVTSRVATGNLSKQTQYQADGVMTYLDSFGGGNHSLDIKLGFSHFYRNQYGMSASGQGAATDLIPTMNASSTLTAISGSDSDFVMQGLFSRVNYDYKSKYLVSLNARYDGASNLGNDYRFGFFPGVSLGWNVHNEGFWKVNPSAISDLKMRASYGVNGNISGLSDFQAQGNYSVDTRYDGQSSIIAVGMPNSNLQWEESKTLDFGLDVSFLKRRINLIADYYVRDTENLLTAVNLPPSSGYSSITTNLGSLRNRGYEVELQADILRPESTVKWMLGFNAGYTKAIITKLPDNGIENNRIGGVYVYDTKLQDYAWKGGLQEGGRIGDMYGYKFLGVYATDAEAASSEIFDSYGSSTNKTRYGGDAYYQDVDGNKIINSYDQVYMGNPYPTWTGGITNALSYKNLSLFTRLDFTTGHTIFNYARRFTDGHLQGDGLPSASYIKNMWKEQGDITNVPRYVRHDAAGNHRNNDVLHEKGDFLAIREVTFAYVLPKHLTDRAKLGQVRFNLTGNNLHYFTNYSGPVPEEGGQDNGHYPIPRTITMGVNVSF